MQVALEYIDPQSEGTVKTTLSGSEAAFKKAASDPDITELEGLALHDALVTVAGIHSLSVEFYNAAGNLQDGPNGEPARREWYENGTLHLEGRYHDGNFQDGPNGEPAEREWHPNGSLFSERHYQNNLLHNGINGEPAVGMWHSDGKSRSEAYYQNGKLHDGPNGEPSLREGSSSRPYVEMRHQNGVKHDGPNGEPAVRWRHNCTGYVQWDEHYQKVIRHDGIHG
jgi:hypothetical protein